MRKKNNNYFTDIEEKAIIEYIETQDPERKRVLYQEIIHPAFYKLSENIVNTYGLKHQFFNLDNNENLIQHGVSYLYSKIDMFDCTRLSKKYNKPVKAYSFFGTILKRYYIQMSMELQKNVRRNIPISSTDSNNTDDIDEMEAILGYDEKFDDDTKVFFNQMLQWFEKNIMFFTNHDKKIVEAIITLCRNVDNIENFNKKHLYILLREMTGESTINITNTINRMKRYYQNLKYNYDNTGEVFSGSIKYR